MHRHFHLAGHRLANFTTIADQHRQRHPVILNQRRQRIDGHTDGCVLHDDGRAASAHIRTGAQAHAFILAVCRHMDHVVRLVDLFDHPGKLLAWHSRHKADIVGLQSVHYDIID